MNEGMHENIFDRLVKTDPAKWSKYSAEIPEKGSKKKIKASKRSPKDLLEGKCIVCSHCGAIARKNGIGAHINSLNCLAKRNELYALSQGYILFSGKPNKYLSPYLKRFLTHAVQKPKTFGYLRGQLWIEEKYAKLIKPLVWYEYSYGDIDYEFSKEICTLKVTEGFEDIVASLAKFKRNGATKKFEAALYGLEVKLEDHNKPQIFNPDHTTVKAFSTTDEIRQLMGILAVSK